VVCVGAGIVRILLVEGGASDEAGVGSALAARGHEVVRAPHVGVALDALAEPKRPCVVLLAPSVPEEGLRWLADEARKSPTVPLFRLVLPGGPAPRRDSSVAVIHVDPPTALPAQTTPPSARLGEAFERTATPMAFVGLDGRVERGNAAFASLTGRSDGAFLRDLVDLRSEDARREECLAAASLALGRFCGEVVLSRSDGAPVPCGVTIAPMAGEVAPAGLVLAWTDLSLRVAAQETLRTENRRLQERSCRDHVSGLYNRAYLEEVLDREVARARRYGQILSALMVDLDGFKRVNDEHGHLVGDQALRAVAAAMRSGLREADVLARYGGDEFCALLPTTDAASGLQVASRMLARVMERRYGPAGRPIGASVGLATTDDLGDSPVETLLDRADQALRAAKRRGGGVVVVWSAEPCAPLAASH
jgi:diguanylate cyclase (GGDEF)-like protein